MGNCMGRRQQRCGHTGQSLDIPFEWELSDTSSDEGVPVDDTKGFCPICFEEKKLSYFYNPESNENFRITPCNHRFCEECFSTHVNTIIDSGSWQVRCPGESCNYVLSAKDVKNTLTTSKYDQWQAARNKSYYERFMSNDQDMRDALKVDKLVAKEIQKRNEAERAKKLARKEKTVKIDGVEVKHGVRVRAAYMSDNGLIYNGTILEVNAQNGTASIAYDDGDFWGFAPLTSIQILTDSYETGIDIERSQWDYESAFDELEHLNEEDIVEGKRVIARLPSGSFSPGIISSIDTKERTASIDYDDGEEWERCPFHLIREVQGDLKCCPQCAVIIHKYDGCDSMTCLCGKNFNWISCRTIPLKLMDELVEMELKKKEQGSSKSNEKCVSLAELNLAAAV